MKKIEIRVWDKKTNTMFYPKSSDKNIHKYLSSIRFIPMLFTGYCDSYKTNIYEGDEVSCKALETTETVIVKDIRNIPVQIMGWREAYKGASEVIGNIYEPRIRR